MKQYARYTLAFAAPVFLAVVFLRLSSFVMTGFEDCTYIDRLSHTIPPLPRPDNCADSRTLMSRDILEFFGIGLFLVPIALVAVLIWRKRQSEETEIEAVRLSQVANGEKQ